LFDQLKKVIKSTYLFLTLLLNLMFLHILQHLIVQLTISHLSDEVLFVYLSI